MRWITNPKTASQKSIKSTLKLSILFLLFFAWSAWVIWAAQNNTGDIEARLSSLQGKEKINYLLKFSMKTGKLPLEKRLSYGNQALKLSMEMDDDELQGKAQRYIGSIYKEMGSDNEALKYLLKSLNIAETNKNQKNIAICLNQLGLIHKHLNQYEKALDFLFRAVEIREKVGDKKRMAAYLNNIALVYKSMNDYDKALEYSLKSLKLKEELGNKKGISATLNNIALLYRQQGKKQKALDFLLQSLKLKKELGNQKGIAISLNNIGLLYKDLYNYDEALESFIQSLKIKETRGDKKAIASSLNNIGVIYMDLEDNELALEYYQRALKFNKDLDNRKGIATSFNNVGIIYNRLKKYDTALASHEKAKKLHGQLNNREGIANSLNNIGLVYRNLKDFNRALTYYREALKINEKIKNKAGISSSLNNMAGAYILLNQYEQAVRHFLRSLEIKKEIGDKKGMAGILIRLGEIYVKTKNFKKALSYIQKSIKLAGEIQEKNTLKECYKTLSELYYEKNDYKKAFEYFKRFGTVKDSIVTRDSSNKIASLRSTLEVERENRQQEIEILKKNNAIKDLKLNRQKIMKNTFIIAFFVFSVFILIILYMYRLKSKSENKLKLALVDTVHEIEERKKVEKEKQQLQEQLFQSQKLESLGRLAGGIAHDFNNLLTGIMGYAELLKIKHDDSQQVEGRAADTIYKNSIAAHELTKQLLGFARKGKYNPVPLNLNHVIKETVNILEKIFEKNIKINYDLDHYVKNIDADENQIIQVLTNLIINAKDAMPKGGEITFKTGNISISEANKSNYPKIIKPGHYVRLSISDTGIGMTKEIIDQIFEPFFTTKGKGKGTGLGLATVYGIVKNHNGYVFCQSQPDAGTTFTLFLSPGNKELIKEKEEVANKTGTGKILVVDDEEFVLNISKDFLKRLGYDVIVADSGNKAVEIYTKNIHQIDLVLLDIIMPGKDGMETFQTLKKIDPQVRVLFFSGFNKNKRINEFLVDGQVGFIEKPFNMKILSDALSELLVERSINNVQ